jgi:hypothetical protein
MDTRHSHKAGRIARWRDRRRARRARAGTLAANMREARKDANTRLDRHGGGGG